jgi:hypothetical protein
MRYLYIVLMAFISIACADQPADGEKETSQNYDYSVNGIITDGLCKTGGLVYVSLLDQSNLSPTTNTYPPTPIINEFGEYDLGISLPTQIVRVDVDATCHNETTGLDMSSRQLYCYNDIASGNKNVNPLCMIIAPRVKSLYNTAGATFQDFDAAEQQATNEIYSFFDVSGVTDRFTSMSLDSTSDANGAYLHMITGILQDRSEVDQMSLITEMGTDLEDNGVIDSVDISSDIQTSLSNVDHFNIKKNVNDKFLSLGSSKKSPPAYKFGDHDNDGIKNVADQDFAFEYSLLEDKVKIIYGINLDAPNTMTSGNPLSTWRYYAHPFVFDETTDVNMIAFNTSGQYLSIYDNDPSADVWDVPLNDFAIGEAPNVALKTISPIDNMAVLNGLALPDVSDVTHDNLPNNFIGKLGFTFQPGIKYWIVLWSDTVITPYYGNNGVYYNEHGGRALCCINGVWQVTNGEALDSIRMMFTN